MGAALKIQRQFYPLVSRMRPRFGLANDYRSTASRTWELAPAAELESLPGIFDEADLQKVLGVYPGNTLEQEVERVRARTVRHGATMAYELRDAVLANGHVFTARTALSVSTQSTPWLARAKPEVEVGVLATTSLGAQFFGHWVHDDLPLILAAESLGQPISVLRDLSPAQNGYLDIVKLRPQVMTDGFLRRMVVIDDNGLNAYRKERYVAVRERATRQACRANVPGVMLVRGTGGALRRLVNEDEVAQLARSRGFLVLDPLKTSAADLIDACTDVPIVLGVEGSQLCNGVMWMAAHGTLVTLQPPQRFTTVLKNWCDIVGTRFAFLVGDASADEPGAFRVDIDAVARLLDRVDSRDGGR